MIIKLAEKTTSTTTRKTVSHTEQSTYDDNKDIIWPTVVGIFVALALGWMICRYKCSSNERSPHIVQCCPTSLCKKLRSCCTYIFEFKSEPPPQQQQSSTADLRLTSIRERLSNTSMLDVPILTNNILNHRPSITQSYSSQWPPTFLSNTNNQGSSLPLSITVQSIDDHLEPKRHPLRRESLLPEAEQDNERRDSAAWPFPSANMIFHKQTNEIKKNHLFFNT
ncbi:unnamed protein product [Adineta ricciae]|uniref:Uncharacterized protein n=1 Tax=Adineta ricciae TaxID=249248 RepID=A0A814L7L5_ADIRI|nr:unnamed protein product [Adineta ricciae]